MRPIVIFQSLALFGLLTACGAPKTDIEPAAVNSSATGPASIDNANSVSVNSDRPAPGSMLGPGMQGQEFKLEEPGIQFVVPKGFKISKYGPDTVILTPDDAVAIRFSVRESLPSETAANELVQLIGDDLKEVSVDGQAASTRVVGGMEGKTISGTARNRNKTLVNFELILLNAPKKLLLINMYGAQAGMDKHAATLKACIDSIRRIS